MHVHLDDSAARLAAIVRSSDDAIVSKDLRSVITSWNAAAERMFGYTAAEAIGQTIHLIIPADRRAEEDYVLAQVKAGVGVDHYETIRQRKDGTMIDISLTVSPIRAPNGEIIGASKIARDITESKRLRMELEKASRAKDEFLAILSHELRTPLNTVLGYAMLLQNPHLGDEEQARAIAAIGRNSEVLMRLVNEVFDTSAMVTGKVKLEVAPCDISALLAEVVDGLQLAASAKEIALETDIEPELIVPGDANRLRQVVSNVLSNAVKFTSEGGVHVSARRDATHVYIVVADTGVGLEADVIPLIFQRFWQADGVQTRGHGGLGLGLALARAFVELHGGTISASSPGLGQGTTFEIRLPARR